MTKSRQGWRPNRTPVVLINDNHLDVLKGIVRTGKRSSNNQISCHFAWLEKIVVSYQNVLDTILKGHGWIECSEVLPENRGRYLVAYKARLRKNAGFKDQVTGIGELNDGIWTIIGDHQSCGPVTHWMPLPDSPDREFIGYPYTDEMYD